MLSPSRFSFFILTLFLLIFSAGCASGPALDKYPTRQIDRPYTLPKGVAAWETWAYAEQDRYGDQVVEYSIPVPIPLFWRIAITDDWNVLWYVLPLGTSYQLLRNDSFTLGMMALISSFGYSSSSGFGFVPHFQVTGRQKIAKDWELQSDLSFAPSIQESNENDFGSSRVKLEAGIAYQASDTIALGSSIGFVREWDSKTWRDVFNGKSFHLKHFENYFPFSIAVEWLMARQWELTAEYTYTGRRIFDPLTNSFFGRRTVQEGIFKLIHYW